MGYHVYALVVNPTGGEVTFLLENLLENGLIMGLDRESSVDHCSGNVTVYLKVGNKDKFIRHFNRKWKESADPTRFVLGKPTYLGYKNKSKKSDEKMEDAKNFIKERKQKKQ